MKKLINIIIFTIILFSFVGCFDNEAREGGFPYLEIADTEYTLPFKPLTLTIPIKSNRELNLDINYDTAEDSWVSLIGNTPSEITLEISENTKGYERMASITISTTGNSEVFDIKITQEGIEYSPEEIFQGDATLRTQEEINEFASRRYKEITGNLIIGKTLLTKAQSTIYNIPKIIDGTTYFFTKNTDIYSLKELSSIKKISGGLYAIGLNIHELHFSSEMTGLETLVAIHNPKLEDISAIVNLRNLKTLHLNNNNISDISTLASLESLETLYLGYNIEETNSIANISYLSSLTNLKELYLNYLPITPLDINQLQSILPNTNIGVDGVPGANPAQIYQGDVFLRTQLEVNNFISNGYTEVNGDLVIGNTSTTESTEHLTNIWIGGYSYYVTRNSSITDLSSLKITHVQGSVYLAGFLDITDLSIISPLLRVRRLHILASTILTDISTLSNFSNLENLYLNTNKITDISPLSNCTKLTQLFLENMEVSDLTPISNLNNLNNLTLTQTKVSDLSPLSKLKSLSMLQLNNNQITSISNLRSFAELKWLYITAEEISDITPLYSLKQLETISLNSLPITVAMIDALKIELPDCNIDYWE